MPQVQQNNARFDERDKSGYQSVLMTGIQANVADNIERKKNIQKAANSLKSEMWADPQRFKGATAKVDAYGGISGNDKFEGAFKPEGQVLNRDAKAEATLETRNSDEMKETVKSAMDSFNKGGIVQQSIEHDLTGGEPFPSSARFKDANTLLPNSGTNSAANMAQNAMAVANSLAGNKPATEGGVGASATVKESGDPSAGISPAAQDQELSAKEKAELAKSGIRSFEKTAKSFSQGEGNSVGYNESRKGEDQTFEFSDNLLHNVTNQEQYTDPIKEDVSSLMRRGTLYEAMHAMTGNPSGSNPYHELAKQRIAETKRFDETAAKVDSQAMQGGVKASRTGGSFSQGTTVADRTNVSLHTNNSSTFSPGPAESKGPFLKFPGTDGTAVEAQMDGSVARFTNSVEAGYQVNEGAIRAFKNDMDKAKVFENLNGNIKIGTSFKSKDGTTYTFDGLTEPGGDYAWVLSGKDLQNVVVYSDGRKPKRYAVRPGATAPRGTATLMGGSTTNLGTSEGTAVNIPGGG
jgi:hypothetical protein